MPSFQTFYPRVGLGALSRIVKTAGFVSSWDHSIAAFGGNGARYLGTDSGATAQVIATQAFSIAGGASGHFGNCQFLSDPLEAQSLDAGTWQLGFSAQTASANTTWNGEASLFVINGANGQRRYSVFDRLAIGSTGRTTSAAVTCRNISISGPTFEVFSGDYFCLELGMKILNTDGSAHVSASTIYTDGATYIASDAASNSTPLAFLTAPVAIDLQSPIPGESRDGTLSDEQCRALLVSLLPPGMDNVFAINDTTSDVYKFLSALSQAIKFGGYDYVDMVFREFNPYTSSAKLPDWEGIFGITDGADEKTAAQRRALILSRFRESGPPTLDQVAQVVSPLLDYTSTSTLSIIEASRSSLTTLNSVSLPAATGAGSFYFPFPVLDDIVQNGVIQLSLNITHPTIDLVYVYVVLPSFSQYAALTNYFSFAMSNVGSGSVTSASYTLMCDTFSDPVSTDSFGKLVIASSTLSVDFKSESALGMGYVYIDGGGLGTVNSLSVFHEAGGRGGTGNSIYTWGVYADPSLVGSGVDYKAALRAVHRLTHAHSRGSLIRNITPKPGQYNAIPSQVIPTHTNTYSTSYSSAVISIISSAANSGLYWRLAERVYTDTATEAISSLSGVYSGATAPYVGREGPILGDSTGGSCRFVAANSPQVQVATTATITVPSTGGVTFGAWIRTGNVTNLASSSAVQCPVMASTSGSATSFGCNHGFVKFCHVNASGSAAVTSTTAINDRDWHLIAATHSSSGAVKLYVDGILDASTATITPATAGWSVNVIGSQDATYYFDGSISEVFIVGGVATAAQLLSLTERARQQNA